MNADGPLLPQDLHLLAAVRDGAEWTRAVLCTLARRGAALRLSDPDRARALASGTAERRMVKQAPWPDNYPQILENIRRMNELHSGCAGNRSGHE